MKRKTNAAKHTEAARPEAGTHGGRPAGGLEDEIALLRWAVRRLYALAQEQDNDEAVKTLIALGATATRLARLVQTQARLPGTGEDELQALLAQALEEVAREFDG